MDTDQEESGFEKLITRVEAIGMTSYNLAKLKSIEVSTHVATSFTNVLIVTVMVVLFASVLNIGIALWLGDILGEAYYGFFVMSIFYLAMGLVIYFFLRKSIRRTISSHIIKKTLD